MHLAALDAVDVSELDVADRVDRDILAGRLAARAFDLTELREHEWNPLFANPGNALHLLLARDYAPLPDRLRALGGRLAAVPAALAQSRASLHDMPEVHVDTAIGQFVGTRTLLATEVERSLRRPSLGARAPRSSPPSTRRRRRSRSTWRGSSLAASTRPATRASARSCSPAGWC